MADDISVAQRILGITQAVPEVAPVVPDPLANLVPDFQTMDTSVITEPPVVPDTGGQIGIGTHAPMQGQFTPQSVEPEYTDAQAEADVAAEIAAAQAPIATEPVLPEPTPEQQAAADAQILAPVQEKIASDRSAKQAERDISADMLREAEEAEQRRESAVKDAAQVVDDVRIRSLPEIMQKGSFGEKLGASIALLVGGISQGLTGARSNPVMDFIDSQVLRQDQKDKMNAEQKIALRKALTDEAQVRLTALENASQDQYRKGQLAVARGQLAQESAKLQTDLILKAEERLAKENSASAQMAAELGQEIKDVSKLSKEQMERLVTMPDGSKRLIDNPKNVAPLTTMRADYEPGIAGINRILAMTKDFNRITDLKKRAQISTELKAVAGQLRIPFTGPGAMTEKEYDRLISTLGDPNALVALPSLERAKLLTVKQKLETDMATGFKRFGLTLPKSREQQLVDSLKAKGYPEEAINKVLGKN